MSLSNIRINSVTSSDIVDIIKSGQGAETVGVTFFSYIEECRAEGFFKQRIDQEIEVFAMCWGKLCEIIVHKKLPTDYKFQSDVTLPHPKIAGWVGTPDGKKFVLLLRKLITDAVTDIKCPTTKKSFYGLIKALYHYDGVKAWTKKPEEIVEADLVASFRKFAKDGEKFYWQLVSNSSIVDCAYAELIVYMPYFEDLEIIKRHNAADKGPNYYPVSMKKDEELPFILKESGVQDLNVIRFKVPENDKMFLEMRARMATELIAMDQKDYDELFEIKGYNKEATIIEFIEQKTGEKIKQVKQAA